MSVQHPSALRLVATLTVAGLLSGLVLVGVHLGTADRIARNRVVAIEEAVKRLLPGTERMTALVVRHGALVPFDGPEGTIPGEDAVFAGYTPEGTLVGYALTGQGNGFMDNIGLLYGYDPIRHVVVGLEIIDSRETPGLGDRISSDPAWLASFSALAVEPEIRGVKDGRDQPYEVDVISGATISSQAVIRILNERNRSLLGLLPEATSERGE